MKKNLSTIIVIVGPTASGKTSLSIKLATKYNGEVISADSRQVYRGLDIGTGKVTKSEMNGIVHHLLDVADPSDTYTVADFVRDADSAISEIISRGKLPIIVGGTFQYIDTLLGKMTAPEVAPDKELRAELELHTTEDLGARLRTLDPVRFANIDAQNRPRLVRAIEIATALGSVPPLAPTKRYNALTLGVDLSKEDLHTNIHKRLTVRLEGGMVDEVVNLHKNGLSYERLEELGIEYKYIAQFLQDKITHEEMCTEIENKSRQYAKRQMTWLKRDEKIMWVKPGELNKNEILVNKFLT